MNVYRLATGLLCICLFAFLSMLVVDQVTARQGPGTDPIGEPGGGGVHPPGPFKGPCDLVRGGEAEIDGQCDCNTNSVCTGTVTFIPASYECKDTDYTTCNMDQLHQWMDYPCKKEAFVGPQLPHNVWCPDGKACRIDLTAGVPSVDTWDCIAAVAEPL